MPRPNPGLAQTASADDGVAISWGEKTSYLPSPPEPATSWGKPRLRGTLALDRGCRGCRSSWGRQMALRSWRTLADYQSAGDDVGAVGLLARLTAGLGQAQSYAAANPAPLDPAAGSFVAPPTSWVEFDAGRAGDAVTGLGLALQQAGHPHRPAPGAAHAVAAGRWSHCPCGDEHGQADLDSGVLDRVRTDLAELARLAPAAAAAATTETAGATSRDQHSTSSRGSARQRRRLGGQRGGHRRRHHGGVPPPGVGFGASCWSGGAGGGAGRGSCGSGSGS